MILSNATMIAMTLDIITIPCLSDNYAYVVVNSDTKEAALIDVPEAAPINAALAKRKDLTLTTVLLTHHHADHIDGLSGLDNLANLAVIGCAADAHRLPALTQPVSVGETISVCGADIAIMAADGHTLNHIAFYVPAAAALFSGDSLMTHGCGRLFEGTAEQMYNCITAFAALPGDTTVYSGHNYADANLAFAKQFSPDADTLAKREQDLHMMKTENRPTSGVTLALEKQLNPYLRTHLPAVKAAVGMSGQNDLAVFTEIRQRKDRF